MTIIDNSMMYSTISKDHSKLLEQNEYEHNVKYSIGIEKTKLEIDILKDKLSAEKAGNLTPMQKNVLEIMLRDAEKELTVMSIKRANGIRS